jgi:ABC-type siderophore export system fused ATPase/permease subunit
MDSTLLIAILCIVIFMTVAILIQRGRKLIAKEKEAKYKQLLKSGNKELALKAAREYYSYLRGGRLSIYDEQAISNDLATMDRQKSPQ